MIVRGLERWLDSQQHLMLLQRTQVRFQHTRGTSQLPVFRGSGALFWSLQAQTWYICIHSGKLINNNNKNLLKNKENDVTDGL